MLKEVFALGLRDFPEVDLLTDGGGDEDEHGADVEGFALAAVLLGVDENYLVTVHAEFGLQAAELGGLASAVVAGDEVHAFRVKEIDALTERFDGVVSPVVLVEVGVKFVSVGKGVCAEIMH